MPRKNFDSPRRRNQCGNGIVNAGLGEQCDDGNNVDGETESLSLYKAYAQYSALLTKITTEFDKYNAVLGATM